MVQHRSLVREVSSGSNSRRRSVMEELRTPSPSLLSVPRVGNTSVSGSSRLQSLTELEVTTPPDPPSDDISPECVSPAVLLVPPPYPLLSTPEPEEPQETKEQRSNENETHITVEEDSAILADPTNTGKVRSSSQRARIRLCDTRLDSGIGDDKHSQESQPSSSGQYYEPNVDSVLDKVVLHTPELS